MVKLMSSLVGQLLRKVALASKIRVVLLQLLNLYSQVFDFGGLLFCLGLCVNHLLRSFLEFVPVQHLLSPLVGCILLDLGP